MFSFKFGKEESASRLPEREKGLRINFDQSLL